MTMWSNVQLTDDEKRMLQGEDGVIPQVCMQYLVEMCEIAGAERLVDLDGTGDMHTPGNQLSPYYGFTYDQLKELADSGAHFKIPTFADKSPFPEQAPIHGWENCNICSYQNTNERQDDPVFHERATARGLFQPVPENGYADDSLLRQLSHNDVFAVHWPALLLV